MDKYIIGFLTVIENFSEAIAKLFESKPKKKRKKRKCKDCHCNCHCSGDLHVDEYGVCTCDNCKCK